MGDSVQVACYVSKGDTPLNIKWMLNGKTIKNVFGISTIPIGDRTNLLTISSVQPEHVGHYTCTASNTVGNILYSAELLVNGTLIFVEIRFYFSHSTSPINSLMFMHKLVVYIISNIFCLN